MQLFCFFINFNDSDSVPLQTFPVPEPNGQNT